MSVPLVPQVSPVSPPSAPATAAAPTAPLVGRATELARLREALDGTPGGVSGGALLVGESGMGKTRLIDTLAAERPGILVAQARIGDRLVPYSTLGRLVRRLRIQAPHAIGSGFDPELAALWPGGPSGNDGTVPAPPRAASLRAWLHRAGPAVRAWVLDDLQWADDASAELLLGLLVTAPREHLPWVIATQPPEAGSVAEALLEAAADLPAVQTVLVPPLARTAVFDWVLARDPGGGPPQGRATRADGWTAALMARAGGQPLHIRWLLDWLVVPAATADPSRLPLPALPTLIGQRLGQAHPTALAVARAAAVAGQDVSRPLLAQLCGLTEEALRDALADLDALGLWEGADFTHARVREAARQATPEAVARQLHARCADWLEAQGGEPARVAAHWQAAGEDARSLPALLQAAARAQRLRCTPDRLAFLMRAAGVAQAQGQDELAFDCCSDAFETHTEAIRHTDGQALLAQMAQLARTPAQQSRSARHHAWHALVDGRLDEAVAQGETALALAESLAEPDLLAPARQVLGTALGVAGQLARGLPLMQAAEAWVGTHLPEEERATFHGNLAAVLDNLGRAEEARDHHEAALDLARQQQAGPQHQATLLANYALSRLEAGDPVAARELARQGQALLEAGGAAQSSQAGFLAVLLAPAERSLGRYAQALGWCDRAEALLASRNPARMPVALLQRAHVWMDIGLHDRALEVLGGSGLAVGRRLPARHAVRWLLLLARALTRCGHDARAALRDAQTLLPAEGWPELPLLLRQEVALTLPGSRAAGELATLAREATASALPGIALGAWLQCALLAAVGSRQPDLAREAAEHALTLLAQGGESTHVDRALRWLAPARALASCGEHTRARHLLAAGQAWLRETARDQLPPDAVEGFLRLHPLNLLLGEARLDPD